jgi:hypothetical protein
MVLDLCYFLLLGLRDWGLAFEKKELLGIFQGVRDSETPKKRL